MPNIHTLTFNCQSIDQTNSISIQQSDTFQSTFNTNTMATMTIKQRYSSPSSQTTCCFMFFNGTFDK